MTLLPSTTHARVTVRVPLIRPAVRSQVPAVTPEQERADEFGRKQHRIRQQDEIETDLGLRNEMCLHASHRPHAGEEHCEYGYPLSSPQDLTNKTTCEPLRSHRRQ